MVERRGVTLMELLMVVAIISVLFGVAAPILNQANKHFILSRAKVELQQEARSLMYVFTRNLRQARSDSILINRANSNQPFYSKITFTKEQGDTLVFQQEGQSLYQVINGVKRVLSKNLCYLAFTFPRSDDMGIISVSMTLRKNIYEGRTKALHVASEKVRVMN
ncbi:MAG: prepilin-type N-terminal cleavage/methylation domain-containing protein [Euryarchaeota archaeon]|nr:prepilin-type N-terminal cleavage/methylation domain-containing protein [Euryarchaeota archaeon]MCG2725810.1 prepilin-type N-terminal cleavage/methylation domain-containing protein [Elusimicrobiota bacterium]